jgi:hypothetical protein
VSLLLNDNWLEQQSESFSVPFQISELFCLKRIGFITEGFCFLNEGPGSKLSLGAVCFFWGVTRFVFDFKKPNLFEKLHDGLEGDAEFLSKTILALA